MKSPKKSDILSKRRCFNAGKDVEETSNRENQNDDDERFRRPGDGLLLARKIQVFMSLSGKKYREDSNQTPHKAAWGVYDSSALLHVVLWSSNLQVRRLKRDIW